MRKQCSIGGTINERRNSPGREAPASYSAECSSASRAFRSQMVTLRPSIFNIPSAWRRERLRETSSRTVPICDASSWLLTGRVIFHSLARVLAFLLSQAQQEGRKPVSHRRK